MRAALASEAGHVVLLLVAFIGLVWVPTYNFAEPRYMSGLAR
jgi:hypothetical protein